MLPAVQKKLDQMDRLLNDVIGKINNSDDQMIHRKPATGKWSAAQVLYHLRLSEEASLGYLRKKIPEINTLQNTGLKNRYRSFLLRMFLLSPLKFKAPPAVSEIPDRPDLEELTSAYLSIRSELREIMSKITESDAGKANMKHPRIGPINAYQTMDFLEAHFIHHENQIKALLKN